MVSKPRCSATAIGLTLIALSSAPRAQDGVDRPAAEALFKDAVALVQAGDFDAGCPKFEAALKLYPSASTAVNVALCQERAGRLATAWSTFHRALTLSKETEGLERREALEKRSRKGIADLEPRLPKLTVTVGSPRPLPEGLEVERDGVSLPAAGFGTPIPVDPGATTVVATAPGFAPFEKTVTAEEGTPLSVVIQLEAEAVAVPVPPPGPAPGPTIAPVVPPAPVQPPDTGVDDEGGVPTWAWIATGAGVVLGGVAVGFLVDDLAAIDNLKTRCDLDAEPVACDADYDVDADNARKNRSGALAIGFGAGGAIALGAGIVGIVTGLSSDEPSSMGLTLTPLVAPGIGGLILGGSL